MLTREDYHPRLILVASGGVFRGTFHAGMSAALWQMRIAPNLIAGASVGTLLGAVYGAMITATCPHEASDLLRDLCLKFLNVDSTVALTHTLKNAAREIGLRARSIHLSPLSLRRHVRAGTRSDPGYAATGAPPELIDAISELFLIPHQATRCIAARFIAGHITDAVRLTFEQFKKETLKRLDIEVALLTTSLLSAAAQDLLRSVPRSSSQPFASRGIAFLATTTNFATRWPHLLGYSDCPSYDFLNAALASGAFPAAFEPVPESSVYPGLGNPNSPYSDGGMFDNLPFLPALFALQKAEAAHWSQVPNFGKWRRVLRMKLACPDLFLAGSLDANPEATADTFEDLLSIYERADMLKNNIKIQAFETLADIFARQGGLLLRKAQPTDEDKKLAISLPCVPVLPIYPTDAEHLNGTFHFCASTGMDRSRIGRSIADGCFQTFHAFQARQAGLTIADAREQFQALLSTEAENEPLKEMSPRRRSILGLLGSRKTPLVQLRDPYKPGPLRDGTCPFFVLADNSGDQPGAPRAFPCPFVAVRDTLDVNGKAVRAIYVQCCADKGHAKTRSQASIPTQT
jgi:predicted acylesterase/phospholipase RssA